MNIFLLHLSFSDESVVAATFHDTLDILHEFSRQFVLWHTVDHIQSQMAAEPLRNYPSLRAVVQVVEVNAEQPSTRCRQLLMHSSNKQFSVKVLLAMSPSTGEIMYVSPAYCGRTPDSQVLAMAASCGGLSALLASDERFVKYSPTCHSGVYMVFGSVESQVVYSQAFEDSQIRNPPTAAIKKFLSMESIRRVSGVSTVAQFEKMSVVAALISNLALFKTQTLHLY